MNYMLCKINEKSFIMSKIEEALESLVQMKW